ncbi:MAG TPA: deoxyguanosinetriphosphate triphosphohydrolase [Anaerolineae bacterium]
MFLTRADLEARERATLAPYAVLAGESRGRVHPEEEHGYRTAFQRDRDRVVHTTAFRRMEYKTQVFVYAEGDYYRNRLTHSIEVAQVGRTMARSLGANEDLTEAIGLAHDLGHPPFGHTGEATLNSLMANDGGFDHQRQTMRVVTYLEKRYPEFPGLNLTYEMREGLVKHDTEYDITDASGYEPEKAGSLECQLANIADELAYSTSDLDDGLRSGLLAYEQVRKLGIWTAVLRSLDVNPNCPLDDQLRIRAIRRLVGMEITDCLHATAAALENHHIGSLADLRDQGKNIACFSSEMHDLNRELKTFLMQSFYRHPRVIRMAFKANHLLTELFNAYVEEPLQLPYETQARLRAGQDSPRRVICDYLAGMTDRYAIQEHTKLFDPEARV